MRKHSEPQPNQKPQKQIKEAKERGLPCAKDTIEAYGAYKTEEAIRLFSSHNVMNRTEVESRYDIYLDTYIKEVNIEALTMIDMAKKEILPAVMKYSDFLADNISKLSKIEGVDYSYQLSLIKKITSALSVSGNAVERLEREVVSASKSKSAIDEKAAIYRDKVLPAMADLREVCDKLEELTDKKYWPIPTYSDILYYM